MKIYSAKVILYDYETDQLIETVKKGFLNVVQSSVKKRELNTGWNLKHKEEIICKLADEEYITRYFYEFIPLESISAYDGIKKTYPDGYFEIIPNSEEEFNLEQTTIDRHDNLKERGWERYGDK